MTNCSQPKDKDPYFLLQCCVSRGFRYSCFLKYVFISRMRVSFIQATDLFAHILKSQVMGRENSAVPGKKKKIKKGKGKEEILYLKKKKNL